eukprot:TRINITY_DN17870_c0_g1_i1.p1 TRINITY_DN17870_c0_g1~~TRINITY_DN17870_c0_g1_i1.p1  ORF type:complete len:117 (+),score=13.50 TRINITY_DN17870_c0_g1_i1:180-530(+)
MQPERQQQGRREDDRPSVLTAIIHCSSHAPSLSASRSVLKRILVAELLLPQSPPAARRRRWLPFAQPSWAKKKTKRELHLPVLPVRQTRLRRLTSLSSGSVVTVASHSSGQRHQAM